MCFLRRGGHGCRRRRNVCAGACERHASRVQRATEDSIAPDVTVDRLVADGERAAQLAADLFRTPSFSKQSLDGPQIGAREALITS